ncbi:alpha/beta-hydrolase [Aureobasidium sp. EXF-3400]|nr:alpha/beta-hydrolase [Aureobasidium sp. EXF-12344]KAI4780313.1 alpha/beta-hydrolase [Aureobasidium sp. EXF-3400]
MATTQEVLLPRPGRETSSPVDSIPGPSEDSFTQTFGHHLPSATYLSTSYGKLAYYTFSPTTQPTTTTTSTTSPSRVLFLHGVQTPALGLSPLAKTLHSSFPDAEMVSVDLWGHGLSSTPVAPHTPSLFHAAIDAVLKALHWSSCHLVGYSFGGSLAISYIASSASRAAEISSVALVAPAGLWRTEDLDEEKLYSPDYSIAKSHVLYLLEGGPLIIPSDSASRIANGEIVAEKIRHWQMQHHPGHTASVISIVRDGGIFSQEEIYQQATKTGIPIIAVLGETDDVVFKKDLKEVGVGNVIVVKGVGHGVVRQEVAEVAKHIGQFWEGL